MNADKTINDRQQGHDTQREDDRHGGVGGHAGNQGHGGMPALDIMLRGIAGRIVHGILSRMRHGELGVQMPNGQARVYRGPEPGPQASVIMHRPLRMLWKVSSGGALGLGESWLAGDWDSDDLAGFLRLLALNETAFGDTARPGALQRLLATIAHGRKRNTRKGSRRNIAAHYDLGNPFYAQWLDPGMTYSSAVFDQSEDSLEQAQQRKYDRILDQLGLQPGEHILEIGCGWGGLAEAAARRGARVTGLTLSREQLVYARERMQRAGLSESVELRLEDYRDVRGQFDHVVSIEMFEAVGEEFWPTYFRCVHDRLRPGGRAALQVITIDDGWFGQYQRTPDFIQRYIFPGGMLPTAKGFTSLARSCGLQLADMNFYGEHYARTLRDWHERFNTAWENIHPLGFDEHFKRMWRYYLAYCEAGFLTGRINLMQVGLVKAHGPEATGPVSLANAGTA